MSIMEISTSSKTIQQSGAAPVVLVASRQQSEVVLYSDLIGLPHNGDTVSIQEYYRLTGEYDNGNA